MTILQSILSFEIVAHTVTRPETRGFFGLIKRCNLPSWEGRSCPGVGAIGSYVLGFHFRQQFVVPGDRVVLALASVREDSHC